MGFFSSFYFTILSIGRYYLSLKMENIEALLDANLALPRVELFTRRTKDPDLSCCLSVICPDSNE